MKKKKDLKAKDLKKILMARLNLGDRQAAVLANMLDECCRCKNLPCECSESADACPEN